MRHESPVALAVAPEAVSVHTGEANGALAHWFQGSIDYEVLTWSGFRLATGIGFAQLVGSSNAKQVCVDYCPNAPRDLWPTVHVTLGFAI